MALTLLLFLLFAFLIVRLVRRTAAALTMWETLAAFGFKAMMACAYGYLFLHYYGGDDTWQFNKLAWQEYELLMNDPRQFFWEFTPVTAWRNAGGNIWQTCSLYLVDLEYCLIAKTLGLFNIISRGNYYANAIFFSFLTFWGHYWLFQLLAGLFPQKRNILLAILFFFPPAVFWLSGIRGDGLLLVFVAMSLLHAYNWIEQRHKVSLFYLLTGFAGILIFRHETLLLLIPALLSWFIIVRYRRKPLPVLVVVYGATALLFFGSAWLPGIPNLPAVVVKRQQDFLALQGNTRFELDTLQPTIGSFLQVLPQAFSNTFLRPFIWEAQGLLQIMTALEILFCWIMAIGALAWRDKSISFNGYPLLWTLLLFSITLYLFIGLAIPFPGAIARYKIIPELLLLTLPAICLKVSGKGKREQKTYRPRH